MRRAHCTVTPAFVRSLARQALAKALPWRGYGRLVTASKILDVLLLAAALVGSLSAVVRRFCFGFGHETARKAIASNLPALDELTRGLLGALFLFGSRGVRSWRGGGIAKGSGSRRATGRCASARRRRRRRISGTACCWSGWGCCCGRRGCG